MGKVTLGGRWKDSDKRWREGWTIAMSLAEYQHHDVIVIEVQNNNFEGVEVTEILRAEGLNKEVDIEDQR